MVAREYLNLTKVKLHSLCQELMVAREYLNSTKIKLHNGFRSEKKCKTKSELLFVLSVSFVFRGRQLSSFLTHDSE